MEEEEEGNPTELRSVVSLVTLNRYARLISRVKRPSAAVWLLFGLALMMALGPVLTVVSGASATPAAATDPPNIPPSVVIAVGYRDTERGIGKFTLDLPVPWCGSAGVQFIGSSTIYNGNSTDLQNCMGGDWDGGAILVTNTGTAPITLTGLTVTLPLPLSGSKGMPSCAPPPRPIVFNLWFGQQYFNGTKSVPAYLGGPITLKSGGQAIFTGTTADGTYECPSGNWPSGPKGSTYDFDTSDSNFLTGCTVTNDTVSDPEITFSAQGYAPTTYFDLGHVIDTGGIDTGMCKATAANPEWPNEDLGWRLINSTCGESCTSNQFFYAATNGTITLTTTATGTSSGSTSAVVAPGQTVTTTATDTVSAQVTTVVMSGVSATTAYGIGVVAVVFIITTGYLALKRGRTQQASP
jgi:hypothetical protein